MESELWGMFCPFPHYSCVIEMYPEAFTRLRLQNFGAVACWTCQSLLSGAGSEPGPVTTKLLMLARSAGADHA